MATHISEYSKCQRSNNAPEVSKITVGPGVDHAQPRSGGKKVLMPKIAQKGLDIMQRSDGMHSPTTTSHGANLSKTLGTIKSLKRPLLPRLNAVNRLHLSKRISVKLVDRCLKIVVIPIALLQKLTYPTTASTLADGQSSVESHDSFQGGTVHKDFSQHIVKIPQL